MIERTQRHERTTPTRSADAARLRVVVGVLSAGFGAVLLRAWALQVLEHPELSERSRSQLEHFQVVSALRGQITDRSGRDTLAGNVMWQSVFVDPQLYAKDERAADPAVRAELAEALGLEPAALDERLARPGRYVRLAPRLSPASADRVRALHLAGIAIRDQSWRVYAERESAAQVLGFVGADGRGLEGIELAEDEVLSGESAHLSGQQDGRGRSLYLDGLGDDPATPAGDDVVLSLDLTIERAAEESLDQAVTRYGARAGIAVVLDPHTGDVLALANAPSWNPNSLDRDDPSAWRDRAVTDLFEPGSTIKPFVAALALESGEVAESDTIDCHDGKWKLGSHWIHDHSRHGVISFGDVIRVSSNIGAAQVGLRMGPERLGATLTAFGFGARTGIGLPGEAAGVLRSPSRWQPIETANIAFGQGFSVTALELASAYATLANGGVRMAPRLVLGVRSARDQSFAPRPPREVERPISAPTAARVTRLLEAVVSADGTGGEARVPGVRVAGKTGTAQKALAVGRGYDDERVVASFAGYAPADDPRLVIVVVVDEPSGPLTFGGEVAAPVFREIAMRALPVVGVAVGADEDEQRDHSTSVPGVVEASLRSNGERPVAAAARVALFPAPVAPRASAAWGAAPDRESGQPGVAPDFAGLSIRAALRESARLGVAVQVSGRGLCVAQEPAAGAALAGDREIRAWFAAPGAVPVVVGSIAAHGERS